jgi:hypothetical protein
VGLEELVAVSLWLSEELMLGVSETLGVWLKLEEDVRLGVTLPLPEMLTLDDPEELGVLLSLEVGEKLVVALGVWLNEGLWVGDAETVFVGLELMGQPPVTALHPPPM